MRRMRTALPRAASMRCLPPRAVSRDGFAKMSTVTRPPHRPRAVGTVMRVGPRPVSRGLVGGIGRAGNSFLRPYEGLFLSFFFLLSFWGVLVLLYLPGPDRTRKTARTHDVCSPTLRTKHWQSTARYGICNRCFMRSIAGQSPGTFLAVLGVAFVALGASPILVNSIHAEYTVRRGTGHHLVNSMSPRLTAREEGPYRGQDIVPHPS